MKSKILIATHKKYNFPNNSLYTPIHVGKTINNNEFGYLGDNTGENISNKNRSFCELTALYWAWQNNYFEKYDFCGLVHYRRYFSGNEIFGDFSILSKNDIETSMSDIDIIVPKKRNYYIENIRSHYNNAHYKEDLDTLENIIKELSPEYLNAFDTIMKRRSLHIFNMFVMRIENFNAYCNWLFELLFELERRVEISNYDNYQSRIFGFLSERLFNVWIEHNKLSTKELKIINIEGENLLKKAINMLKRKYLA